MMTPRTIIPTNSMITSMHMIGNRSEGKIMFCSKDAYAANSIHVIIIKYIKINIHLQVLVCRYAAVISSPKLTTKKIKETAVPKHINIFSIGD